MDKKQEILKAALKLFVGFGFHATPTSKIAKEAGVANGTLFHYFKSKEELIVALYLTIWSQLRDYMHLVVNQEDGFKSQLKSYFTKNIEWALENPMEYNFLQQFSVSPFSQLIPQEEINDQRTQLNDILEKGIKSNELKPLPTTLLYTLVNSHIEGVKQFLTQNKVSLEEREELINEAFDLFGV